MSDKEPIEELFDTLIQDKVERKIMTLIIEDREPEEIIEELITS